MHDELYLLHKKYAQGTYKEKWVELVWTHSNIILEIALKIAENLESEKVILINIELLAKGTLLHDIGVYQCYDEDLNPDKKLKTYINHGFIGAEIIKSENFSESVSRFAITHTATGLTKEDVERENLPYEKIDYIPITLEEELLCYADKFHSKYPAFSSYEKVLEQIKMFDPKREIKLDNLRRKFGIPDLAELKERYEPWHSEFEKWYKSIN
jgi:uncharacterized protein